MFFLFWLCLHMLYLAVVGLIIPHAGSSGAPLATWKDAAVVFTYYFIGFSWLLSPSEPTAETFIIGLLAYVAGAALALWAMAVNRYFVARIQAPPEVIRSGPYKLLRHPGYAGFSAMAAGTVLMLGHRLGVIPLAVYVAALLARARRENKILDSL